MNLRASSIATIVGANPYETPAELLGRMQRDEPLQSNEHMDRGTCLEPGLVSWWERVTGGTAVRHHPACEFGRPHPECPRVLHLNHPRYSWTGATLDAVGLIGFKRYALEFKAPVGGKAWAGEGPLMYRLQNVYQQGIAAELGHELDGGFLCAGPLWGKLVCIPVAPDPSLYVLLLERARAFMVLVREGGPIPADWLHEEAA